LTIFFKKNGLNRKTFKILWWNWKIYYNNRI